MLASPVLDLQKEAGARLAEAHGWHLPGVYSSMEEEYQAATRGVGLLDRSYVGRLKITGDDGLDLLNRLSTYKLDDLVIGQGAYTVLTSNKGRILDVLFVLRLEDHLLALTSPENRQKVADWIDLYTFVEDVTVQDTTEDTAMLAMIGPEASVFLGELTGQDVSSLPQQESLHATIGEVEVLIVRTDFINQPGHDIVVPCSRSQQVWKELLDRGETRGVRPVGMDALEAVRIERGVPVYGKDMNEDNNPLEANLIDAISFNKGCYIGQEVVARLDTYKKVQKHLVGLSWDTDDAPIPGASLLLDEKKVGKVTSVVRSPRLGKHIGLGYVRKAQAEPGVQLMAESPDGSKVAAQVEGLPFSSGGA
jgi:glycine cleavage system T protein